MSSPDQESQLAGVRLALFFLSSARLWVGGAIVFALCGALLGAVFPAPFAARAAVKIGHLTPKEPIEGIVVASSRMQDAALAIAERVGTGTLEVSARPGRHRPHLGTVLDVVAHADTASAAQSIRDGALRALIAAHDRLRAHETEINHVHQQAVAARSRGLVDDDALVAGQTEAELPEALLLARQDEAGMELMGSQFQAPSTNVARTDPEVRRSAPRALFFALVGLLVGGLLGLALALVRRADPEGELGRTFAFYRRHGALIFGAGAGLALLGALTGLIRTSAYTGQVTLQSARVAPSPQLEHVSVTQLRIGDDLEAAERELCDCKLAFEVIPVRSALRDSRVTDVVRVTVQHQDPEVVTRALERAAEAHVARQTPPQVHAVGLWTKKIGSLEADLVRLQSAGAEQSDQVGIIKLMREIGATRRYLSPARSTPPRVLIRPRVAPPERAKKALMFGLLGLVGGLLAGVVLAYLRAASALRRAA